VDPRSSRATDKLIGEQTFALTTQDPSLNVPVRISRRSLAYLAMGIVLRALKHGWMGSNTIADKQPYFAFRYLIDTFTNALQGSFPALQSAPKWLWEICAALNPKTENFKVSKIVYTGAAVDGGIGEDVSFSLGAGDESYVLFWGQTGIVTVNDFPTLMSPGVYDQLTNGQASAQAMFEFFPQEGLNVRETQPEPSSLVMTHDTSAFAAVYSELGASYFNPAGMSHETFSERFISAPVFAKFVPYQGDGDEDNWRGFHRFAKSGGSASYIGPRLSELTDKVRIHNKCPPIIKIINFDEIFEVLSLTLCMANENMLRAGQPAGTCPLTALQVQILLRQALLPLMSNELAQDLRQTGPAWIPMLPLVVGPNGVSQGAIGMKFPMILAENIRCLKRRVVKLNKGSQNPIVLDIFPLLCRPAASVIGQMGQYTWGPADDNLYTVDPLEFYINLIDCSSVIPPDTFYLSLTGKTLATICETWNTYIEKLSGCLTSLTPLSTEPGPMILNSLHYTNHYRYTPDIGDDPDPPPPVPSPTSTAAGLKKILTGEIVSISDGKGKRVTRAASRKKIGSTVKNLRHHYGANPSVESSIFQKTAHSQVTSGVGFTSPVWKYVGMWILPCAFTNTSALDASLSALQSNWVEPFSNATSATYSFFAQDEPQVIFPTMYEKHVQFATVNVRPWNSPVLSEAELEFQELTKKGGGGFLGNLAGTLLNGFGLTDLGNVAKGVGDALGI
jgi:hypothetical protein